MAETKVGLHENIDKYIEECKKLQKESIAVAEQIRADELNVSLHSMSTIMKNTPQLLKAIYRAQQEYGVDSILNKDLFDVIGSMGEEFTEVILIEDWVSLSDMLEFEYAPLLERIIVSLEDAQKEMA